MNDQDYRAICAAGCKVEVMRTAIIQEEYI
jgi:hypothetical protein